MAMTRACFDTALSDLDGLTAAGLDGFEVFVRFAVDFGERFFADFVIGTPSVDRGVAPHHRSPTTAVCRRGEISMRHSARRLSAVPLQWRSDASPFWIILLLSRARNRPNFGIVSLEPSRPSPEDAM